MADVPKNLMDAINNYAGKIEYRCPAGYIGVQYHVWQVSCQEAKGTLRTDWYYVTADVDLNFGGLQNVQRGGWGLEQLALTGYELGLLLDGLENTNEPGMAHAVATVFDPSFPETTVSSTTETTSVSTSLSGSVGFFGDQGTGSIGVTSTFGESKSKTIPGVSYQNMTHGNGINPLMTYWKATFNDSSIDFSNNTFQHAAMWSVTVPKDDVPVYEQAKAIYGLLTNLKLIIGSSEFGKNPDLGNGIVACGDKSGAKVGVNAPLFNLVATSSDPSNLFPSDFVALLTGDQAGYMVPAQFSLELSIQNLSLLLVSKPPPVDFSIPVIPS
ncbi:MAG: hypothetical protein ACOY0T_21785 [Myxococcota bacterium]